jgi:alkanesulfonate monooxygenase SsuD/methylene tetrahydromethanopterin reductase-like flavin-dependent oxidoreductase (luciferase family)
LMQTHGEDGEITLEEFFDHGLKAATSYGTTVAGTAAQIADDLEERFEASGSRGGFMLRHSQAEQIEALHNIVDLLVPELQRRGRFRTAYTGRTLRENLAT